MLTLQEDQEPLSTFYYEFSLRSMLLHPCLHPRPSEQHWQQSQQHLLIFFLLICFALSLIEMMRCQQRRCSPWILMVVVLLLLGLPWGML